MQDESASEEKEEGSSTHGCPKRRRQRFHDSDLESDDGMLRMICNEKEPVGCSTGVVFWIDCDMCDTWVHAYCAFGSSTTSHRYVCDSCAFLTLVYMLLLVAHRPPYLVITSSVSLFNMFGYV